MGKTTLKCGRPLPPADRSRSQAPSRDWITLLAQYGESKGLRKSDQRTQIAELVMDSQGHFSPQDVVKRVQSRFPTIGAATVYRTLSLLRDAGLLKETLVDDEGSTIYEIADGDHHDHIVCLDCGQLVEFHDARIEAAQGSIMKSMGFSEVRHRHVIYAHCEFLKK